MKITVNGQDHNWPGGPIAYADIAVLAYPGEPWERTIPHPLTVTYSWRGDGDVCRGGILTATCDPIEPAEGMYFSAYNTGSA